LNLLGSYQFGLSPSRTSLCYNAAMKAKEKKLYIGGQVIQGDKVGRVLGYPTANLSGRTSLDNGVYTGWVEIKGELYAAMAIIGVDGKKEVHVLNWQGNLYGRKLRMTIVKKLRGIRRFSDMKKLKAQIRLDIKRAKQFLKTHS
jgi:riboflavin kinase / FMN adenylyltransferase